MWGWRMGDRRRGDAEKQQRGDLARELGGLREMLPGSFVERHFRCGKPTCHCADGIHLHHGYQLSLLVDGKWRTVPVPSAWAAYVRDRVAMHKRAQGILGQICQLNLREFVRRKAAKEPPP